MKKRIASTVLAAGALTAFAGTEYFGGQAVLENLTRVTYDADLSSDKTLTFKSDSAVGVLDWSKFNLPTSEHAMNFNGDSTTFFNLVDGTAGKSQINGAIESGGSVWVVNPSGVAFGPGAVVNVGGLFAAAAGNIANADALRDGSATLPVFSAMAGNVEVSGADSLAAGQVALLGRKVAVDGADMKGVGSLSVGAADKVVVDEVAGGKIELKIEDFLEDATGLADVGVDLGGIALGDASHAGDLDAKTEGGIAINGDVVAAGEVVFATLAKDGASSEAIGMKNISVASGKLLQGKSLDTAASGEVDVDGSVVGNEGVAVASGGDIRLGNDAQVAASGTLSLDAGGDVIVGETGRVSTSGDLSISAGGAGILADGVLVAGESGKKTTLSAANGEISAKNSGNDFDTLDASAKGDIAIADNNALTLGTVASDDGSVSASASGDIVVAEGGSVASKNTESVGLSGVKVAVAGDVAGGSVTVEGDLDHRSGTIDAAELTLKGGAAQTDGAIAKVGSLVLDADGKDVSLDSSANMVSGVSGAAKTLDLATTSALEVGGDLSAEAATLDAQGGITQTPGGTIAVATLALKSDATVKGTVSSTTIDAGEKTLTVAGATVAADEVKGNAAISSGSLSAGKVDGTIVYQGGTLGVDEITGDFTMDKDGATVNTGKIGGNLEVVKGTVAGKDGSLEVAGTTTQSGGVIGADTDAVTLDGALAQTGGEIKAATLTLKENSTVQGAVAASTIDAGEKTLAVEGATVTADDLKGNVALSSGSLSAGKVDGSIGYQGGTLAVDEIAGGFTMDNDGGVVNFGKIGGNLEVVKGTVAGKDGSLEVVGTTTQSGGVIGTAADAVALDGALAQTGGEIKAATLTLKEDSTVQGTVAASTIDVGEKTLTVDGATVAADEINGNLSLAAGTVAAPSVAGDVSLAGGTLTTGEVGGSLALDGGEIVAKDDALTVGGVATQVSGTLGDGNDTLFLAGGLDQRGGVVDAVKLTIGGPSRQSDGAAIKTPELALDASGKDVILSSGANEITSVSGTAGSAVVETSTGIEVADVAADSGNLRVGTASGKDVTVSGAASAARAATIDAGGSVSIAADVTAGGDLYVEARGGDVVAASGVSTSAGGDAFLGAAGDVKYAKLSAGGTAWLKVGAGKVESVDGVSADSRGVLMEMDGDIGTASDPFRTSGGRIALKSNSGNVYVESDGPLTVGVADGGGRLSVDKVGTDGSASKESTTAASGVTAAGTATVKSSGDVTIAGAVVAQGGAARVDAGGNVTLGGQVRGTTVSVRAGGGITQPDGSVAITGGNAASGGVRASVVSGGTANLSASGAIGSASPGSTSYVGVDAANVSATAGGDVALASGGNRSFTVGSGGINAGGDIALYTKGTVVSQGSISAGGDLTVASRNYGGGVLGVSVGSSIASYNLVGGENPLIAIYETTGGNREPEVLNLPNRAIVFLDGRVAGGDLKTINKLGSVEAFPVQTPELKSEQGVFGNPTFLHDELDVANPLAVGAIDFILQEIPRQTFSSDFPVEVDSHLLANGLSPTTSYWFGQRSSGSAAGDEDEAASVEER